MNLRVLRVVAVLLALSLMIGEAWRSWGAGRPFAFWIDDQIMGLMLIAGAALMARPSKARWAFFGAAWGVNAGMLYPSFFGKVFDPKSSNPGNFDLGVLTALIGIAFAVSIAGLVGTIMAAQREQPTQ